MRRFESVAALFADAARVLAVTPFLLALTAHPGVAAADTVLITGANSGIGLEFARQYAAKGWTVIATHRRPETPRPLAELAAKYNRSAEEGIPRSAKGATRDNRSAAEGIPRSAKGATRDDKVRIEKLDVTSVDQVNALATRLADVPIDVLINNAGVYNDRSKCSGDDEGCPGDWKVESFGSLKYSLLDTMMAVNIKGPLIVSEGLYRNVLASTQKKIVAISSSNGTLTGEPQPRPGAIFYRMSKAALNREMQIVAASTRQDGVTVIMLNPGPTLTEHQEYLKDYKGMLKTSFTVENMITTIDKSTLADTGRFLRYDGAPEPW